MVTPSFFFQSACSTYPCKAQVSYVAFYYQKCPTSGCLKTSQENWNEFTNSILPLERQPSSFSTDIFSSTIAQFEMVLVKCKHGKEWRHE